MFHVVSREVDNKGNTTVYKIKSTEADVEMEFTPSQAYIIAEMNKLIFCVPIVDSNGNRDIQFRKESRIGFNKDNKVVEQ